MIATAVILPRLKRLLQQIKSRADPNKAEHAPSIALLVTPL